MPGWAEVLRSLGHFAAIDPDTTHEWVLNSLIRFGRHVFCPG